jgi:hypothetical protein
MVYIDNKEANPKARDPILLEVKKLNKKSIKPAKGNLNAVIKKGSAYKTTSFPKVKTLAITA